MHNSRPDWKFSLESIEGIYLVTDKDSGKRYVGSADDKCGVRGRLCENINSGHGRNVELITLSSSENLDCYRKHFKFALMEYLLSNTPDDIVQERKSF